MTIADLVRRVRRSLDAQQRRRSLPRYRWSYSAGVWVLQGLHRFAPPEVFPSTLRPGPVLMLEDENGVVSDHAAWFREYRAAWNESDGFAVMPGGD